MKIIKFEPGDGTSYQVLYHPCTPEEQALLGGRVLYGFGLRGKAITSYAFNPGGVLMPSYYCEKLDPQGSETAWTIVAGMLVYCALTDTELGIRTADWRDGEATDGERCYAGILHEWDANWMDQLTSLRGSGEGVGGDERGGRQATGGIPSVGG